MQVLGSVLNGQLGVAARIAALRRSSPGRQPAGADADRRRVPDPRRRGDAGRAHLVHAGRSARAAVVAAAHRRRGDRTASAGLRHLALRKGRELWNGLAVLRSLSGGSRVIGFVLVAVFAQIFRNWMLLHAVGVDASFFDAIAVLIAVVDARSAAGRSQRRRRGRGAHPRQRRRGGGRGGRRADDRHRHGRRPVLRRVGRRRPAVVGRPPAPARGRRGREESYTRYRNEYTAKRPLWTQPARQ